MGKRGEGKIGRHSRQKYKNIDTDVIDSDEYFAYIIGYTSNGFAYGITHEEWGGIEEQDEDKSSLKIKNNDFLSREIILFDGIYQLLNT